MSDFQVKQRLIPVADIAFTHNCWLNVGKEWFTPLEFSERYRHANPLKFANAQIRNPLSALEEGRRALANNINRNCSIQDLLKGLDRLNKFSDKLIKEGFRAMPGQQDFVKWRD